MSPYAAASWLVVFFEDQLAMSMIDTEPPDAFVVHDLKYLRRRRTGIMATCDRLLNDEGILVGIQVWPVPDNAGDLIQRMPRVTYLEFPIGVPCFQLFFSGNPIKEVESGGEQTLSAEIYEAHPGHIAMGIDLSELLESDAEIAAIQRAGARLVTLGR